LLDRFAPRAHGVPPPVARERVSLLLATDLLSEGVNLQDASVVVHLDLPWNPARLAQRLGRVRRPGGAADVASYLMAPPARAALLLRAEERLRAKLARAEGTIGRSLDVLPRLVAGSGDAAAPCARRDTNADDDERPLAAAELFGEIDRMLGAWRRTSSGRNAAPAHDARDDPSPVCAAVSAPEGGWLAALDDGRLVAALEHEGHSRNATEAPRTVARALALAAGPARVPRDAERTAAERELAEWLTNDRALRACALDAATSHARRRLLRLVGESVRAAPRHRLAETIAVAGEVRAALARPLPLGLERELAAIAEQRSDDWLGHAAAALASAQAPYAVRAGDREPRATAIIILGGATELPYAATTRSFYGLSQ
jgi:hypothetical protein